MSRGIVPGTQERGKGSTVSLDERSLVKRARQGDVAAFEELIEDQQEKVYNLAYRMLGDQEGALDLAQEAFLKAFQNLKTFRFQAKFSTWIYRIATNLCLDEIRKAKRRPLEHSLDRPLEMGDGEITRELPSSWGDPEEHYYRSESERIVQQGLMGLSPEQRSLIIMRDLDDLSYQEIAERTGLPLGTVKSGIYRARQALKEVLIESELIKPGDV